MLLREMRSLPPAASAPKEASLQATLLIPARGAGPELRETVRVASAALEAQFGTEYEIILIPNPGEGLQATKDQSAEIALEIARGNPRVRVCPHHGVAGKGAALRTGFLESRGAWIFFTDADLPYDLAFFARAGELLQSDVDFVTGNRRLPLSEFEVPVTLLPVAYKRHRLGLWFNSWVRLLLPIRTTDTQAGIKAMTREFAHAAFAKQACPGFFFDIEFFLTCQAQGFRHADLTVELFLRSEKSTVKVLRQSILAAFWLGRITARYWTGAYGRPRKPEVLGRFTDLDFGTRFFLRVRWALTPYSRMAEWLPRSGRILDLGCGHGLLTLWCAIERPDRSLLGIDHDERRIGVASRAGQGIANLAFRKGSVLPMPDEKDFVGITMIDVFHYFTPSEQYEMARGAFLRLAPGGVLLAREVDPEPRGLARLIGSWNRLYERVATSIGFTQSAGASLHFRSRSGWEEFFRSAGFDVHSEPCSSAVFSDVLFVCRKPAARTFEPREPGEAGA